MAADYLHTTSRALEPQLHHHVVVANFGVGPDGVAHALDARFVFHHAKTASFLAAAELRHQLTARLGVTWTQVENGIAEIEGVPAAALEEMSSPGPRDRRSDRGAAVFPRPGPVRSRRGTPAPRRSMGSISTLSSPRGTSASPSPATALRCV